MTIAAQETRIAEIARLCRPVAAVEPQVLGLYLFGSEADGTAGDHSDVDLGVLFPRGSVVSLGEIVRLEADLAEAVQRDVDLVSLSTCNAFLALQAIRGERIYERDDEASLACDKFDLYVMRRAGDLAPFERERRRMILREGAGGGLATGGRP